MFTGIIAELQPITAISPNANNKLVSIGLPADWELSIGESITVDGVCSTVITITDDIFEVEYMPESLRLTTMGQRVVGDKVNLERSLTAADFLSGHIVQGHVDGMGTVESIEKDGEASWRVTIGHDGAHPKYLIQKGSITVNGMSLTVIDPTPTSFTIAIIPHTWEHTNIHTWVPGTAVNLEYDVMAKYLERLAGPALQAAAGVA